MRPDTHGSDDEDVAARGSLSDFSDYESSDGDTHNRRVTESRPAYGASSSRPYGNDSDDGFGVRAHPRQPPAQEDPFADPFGDSQEVSTPGIESKKQIW